MNFLLDPNVAYLILVAGGFLGLLAIVTPGTGIIEIGAIFCLTAAGYAAYHLSIHVWALIVLILSFIPFYFALRNSRQSLYLAAAILLQALGSAFFFADGDKIISVNPFLALGVSAVMAVSMWLVMQKLFAVLASKPLHELDDLLGQIGEAKSKIHKEGSVYVASEMWSARSEKPIPAGSLVRVVSREGFVLVVEKDSQSKT